MLNRYLVIRRSPAVITIIMGILVGNVLLNHASTAFPAQRRPYSLVDRLIRANPLRALANLFRRNIAMDFYYPPVHPLVTAVPMRMPGSGQVMTTHYVKMPVYYLPPAIPMMASVAMFPPVTRQPAQLQSPQPYVLHGVSYPMEQQQHFVQPAVSTYQQPVPLAPSLHQTNLLGQTGQELNYLNLAASSTPPPPPPPPQQQISISPSLNQVESPPELIHSDYGGRDQSSQFISNFVNGNNADKELSPQEGLQLHVPSQYEHHSIDDVSSAGNSESVKIVVIRPSDLQNMKKMEELARGAEISAPSQNMVKGYTMKYVDMGDGENDNGTPEFLFDSQNVQFAPIGGGDTSDEDCVEPMCDPFLRKLIPELLASSSFRHAHSQDKSGNEDEPIVIVKSDNDTVIPVDYSVSFLNKNYGPPDVENEQVTLVRQSIEENNADPMQAEEDSSSRSKRVHFPRRKLFSSKINSTSSLLKYNPKRRAPSTRPTLLQMHKKLHNLANYHRLKSAISTNDNPPASSTDEEVIPKPRIFKVEKSRSHPYSRYGSKTPRNLSRMIRRANKQRTSHYTAGIVFNDELKAVEPTV